jgi:hypothetical protein
VNAIVIIPLVLAAIGYVLTSRLRGQPLNIRRLLVLPAVLSGIGLLQVIGLAGHGARVVDLVMIGVGVAVSAAMGAVRGVTVAVYAWEGRPWLRYRPATLAMWGATIAARVAVAAATLGVGSSLATRGPAILLSVGITLLAESIVVARRAFSAAESGWHAQAWRHPVATR